VNAGFDGKEADRHFARELDRHTDRGEADEDIVRRYAESRIRDELPKDWRCSDPLELAETISAIWVAYESGDLDAEAMADAEERGREERCADVEDARDALVES
jgi:hypothetical protein